MEMTITETPFVALDYLTQGNPTGLTPSQIHEADEWAEMFEIESVEEYMEEETLSHEITNQLINEMEMEEKDIG